MACLSRIILVALSFITCWAQNFETANLAADQTTIELRHGGHRGNVVKGKRRGEIETANLEDVRKFFPKVTTNEGSREDSDSVDGFTDSIADSLDDSQSELLVAGVKPSKVCARDIKRFCPKGDIKTVHPLHCLGLLKDEERSQIHKLCRVHIQESLQFTCAKDMQNLECDPVMSSTIDCLTEGIDKLSQECHDQVRLVAKVVAKVNNAHITVKTQSGSMVHDGEYNDGDWECPNAFTPHATHAPCCYFQGQCNGGEVRRGGSETFRCAKSRCHSNGGKWVLKDPEGFELAGHLCCPSKKNGVQLYRTTHAKGINGEELDSEDDEDELIEAEKEEEKSWTGTIFFLCVVAVLVYWQRNAVHHALNVVKQMALGEVGEVETPLKTVELTTFITGLFSAIKKETDFVKVPMPKQPEATKSRHAGASIYGGL